MVFWWTRGVAHPIVTLREMIDLGFAADIWTQALPASAQFMRTIPFWEYLLRTVLEPLFWAFSFIGCLAFFSRRFGNRHGFVLAIIGLALLVLGVLSAPLDIGVLSTRWQYASVFVLAIPAGLGLFMVFGTTSRGTGRALLVFVFFAVLTFLSVASPLANNDHPLTSVHTTVRYAFKESELRAANTIADVWGTEMVTDSYYLELYPAPDTSNRSISDNLISRDFSDLEDQMVVIRKEVLERPFHLPEVYQLDYDPRNILQQQGFSQIYDCGTVSGFAHSAG
jgi:hypothetical protein